MTKQLAFIFFFSLKQFFWFGSFVLLLALSPASNVDVQDAVPAACL